MPCRFLVVQPLSRTPCRHGLDGSRRRRTFANSTRSTTPADALIPPSRRRFRARTQPYPLGPRARVRRLRRWPGQRRRPAAPGLWRPLHWLWRPRRPPDEGQLPLPNSRSPGFHPSFPDRDTRVKPPKITAAALLRALWSMTMLRLVRSGPTLLDNDGRFGQCGARANCRALQLLAWNRWTRSSDPQDGMPGCRDWAAPACLSRSPSGRSSCSSRLHEQRRRAFRYSGHLPTCMKPSLVPGRARSVPARRH